MGRPAQLSQDAICAAALDLLAENGSADFTLRALGDRLGVDATAVYRHFTDKDDLLLEIGDRSLAPVTRNFRQTADPVDDVRRLSDRLRNTLIKNPATLSIVAAGPTRRRNELRITEIMLDALQRSGLEIQAAVIAYHAIIEYTLGSAWLDAPLAAAGASRAVTYRTWRRDYAELDQDAFPATTRAAGTLYPSSNTVFSAGLDALLTGLINTPARTRTAPSRSRRPASGPTPDA